MPGLFMILIGCTPPGRHIEQHDVFFGIGETLEDLIPEVISFWPENKLHLDGWRKITRVDGYKIEIVPADAGKREKEAIKLFFLNLGGYKQREFEEFHYKMLIAAPGKTEAINRAKQTAFYRHTGFEGAPSHIDDKYGVDVDDVYEITDILDKNFKARYRIIVTPAEEDLPEDEICLGYFRIRHV